MGLVAKVSPAFGCFRLRDRSHQSESFSLHPPGIPIREVDHRGGSIEKSSRRNSRRPCNMARSLSRRGAILLPLLILLRRNFAGGGTFWDIVRFSFEPRRRGRRFGAQNEPEPVVPVARSQRSALTLILRQDDRFDRSRWHRLHGVGQTDSFAVLRLQAVRSTKRRRFPFLCTVRGLRLGRCTTGCLAGQDAEVGTGKVEQRFRMIPDRGIGRRRHGSRHP